MPNWERFQHYKDRIPLWIKVYTELNSDPDWVALTFSERGLLVTIWLEYARSRGSLRSKNLPQTGPQRNLRRGLERLNDAGFIELVASTHRPHIEKSKKRKGELADALAPEVSASARKEEEEPPRDPEAIERIQALAHQIGRSDE